jgi:hypothetical protein
VRRDLGELEERGVRALELGLRADQPVLGVLAVGDVAQRRREPVAELHGADIEHVGAHDLLGDQRFAGAHQPPVAPKRAVGLGLGERLAQRAADETIARRAGEGAGRVVGVGTAEVVDAAVVAAYGDVHGEGVEHRVQQCGVAPRDGRHALREMADDHRQQDERPRARADR